MTSRTFFGSYYHSLVKHSPEVCWWKELEDGIEFFDISNCPNSKKQLSHFRSTFIAEEVNHVEECWNHLLSLRHKIPAFLRQNQMRHLTNKYLSVIQLKFKNLSPNLTAQ